MLFIYFDFDVFLLVAPAVSYPNMVRLIVAIDANHCVSVIFCIAMAWQYLIHSAAYNVSKPTPFIINFNFFQSKFNIIDISTTSDHVF